MVEMNCGTSTGLRAACDLEHGWLTCFQTATVLKKKNKKKNLPKPPDNYQPQNQNWLNLCPDLGT